MMENYKAIQNRYEDGGVKYEKRDNKKDESRGRVKTISGQKCRLSFIYRNFWRKESPST